MRLFTFIILTLISAQAAQPVKCPPGPAHLAMDKGEYTSLPGVVFQLEGFSANLVPRGPKMPICLAKMTDVERGRVVVSDASLTKLFAQKMKTSKKQSVSDLEVHAKGDHIVIKGKVHKVIAIPFEIEGPVDTTGSAIRFHADKIKAVGLPVKGLLNMLGLELGNLINPEATRGVSVRENSILFKPEDLANTRGQLARVQVSGSALIVDFRPAEKQEQAKSRHPQK